MSAVPPPGPHGGDGPAVAAALGLDPAQVLDLSQTLNPCAPPAAEVVGRHLDALVRYPDDGAATEALAAAMGVEARHLLLTNGGAEAIALLAAELGPGWAEPDEFSLYRRHLALHDRPGRPGLDRAGPRWRSNPHNPLGTLAPPPSMAGTWTSDVWDEAFWPLSTGTWTRGDADLGHHVVGSLTKLLACPGLRVGYVLTRDASRLGKLRQRRPRWSVNGLACAALPDLLATVDLPAWSATIAAWRADLADVLASHGLTTRPSVAPWLLVTGCPDLRRRLARQAVVVRDCASFGHTGTFRLAVTDPTGLARLDGALTAAGVRTAAEAARS